MGRYRNFSGRLGLITGRFGQAVMNTGSRKIGSGKAALDPGSSRQEVVDPKTNLGIPGK